MSGSPVQAAGNPARRQQTPSPGSINPHMRHAKKCPHCKSHCTARQASQSAMLNSVVLTPTAAIMRGHAVGLRMQGAVRVVNLRASRVYDLGFRGVRHLHLLLHADAPTRVRGHRRLAAADRQDRGGACAAASRTWAGAIHNVALRLHHLHPAYFLHALRLKPAFSAFSPQVTPELYQYCRCSLAHSRTSFITWKEAL